MSQKAVKEPGEAPIRSGWQAPALEAPSLVRPDEPTLARIIGFCGLLLVTIACASFLARGLGWNRGLTPGWAIVCFVTGIGAMLYHAAADKDVQYRRAYGALGFAWLLAGFICSLVPVNHQVGSLFLPYGASSFLLGLLFLLPVARNEDDPLLIDTLAKTLGGIGVLLAVIGFLGGNVSADFLTTRGLPMILLGLFFLWAFVGVQGSASDRGYWVGFGMGAVGLLVFVVALGRSLLPPLLFSWGWITGRPANFLVPQGLLLMCLGLIYLAVSLGICSDNRFVVLVRKELASYFYSPIAYVVLFGLAAVGWDRYGTFLNLIVRFSERPAADLRGDPLVEPIVGLYVLDWYTILALVFVVPVLTMRLFSEEKRTGTLEVLFTAPVREYTVVLSKFVAVFVFFMLAWLPWALYLVDLRVEGGREFDYRPMLSFFLSLACSGAAFLAMGLFFSSLTRNQIAAAILTFVGMMLLTGVYFLKVRLPEPNSSLGNFLGYFSYLELWLRSIDGLVIPRYLIFQVSMAVFWLFLTMKVLEARKWA